jgi:hypothetical protein
LQRDLIDWFANRDVCLLDLVGLGIVLVAGQEDIVAGVSAQLLSNCQGHITHSNEVGLCVGGCVVDVVRCCFHHTLREHQQRRWSFEEHSVRPSAYMCVFLVHYDVGVGRLEVYTVCCVFRRALFVLVR